MLLGPNLWRHKANFMISPRKSQCWHIEPLVLVLMCSPVDSASCFSCFYVALSHAELRATSSAASPGASASRQWVSAATASYWQEAGDSNKLVAKQPAGYLLLLLRQNNSDICSKTMKRFARCSYIILHVSYFPAATPNIPRTNPKVYFRSRLHEHVSHYSNKN